MIAFTKQHGFLLPLVTLLMALFSGIWLVNQPNSSGSEANLAASVELQQELLFWHRGVLHFHRHMNYWPANLNAVASLFQVNSPPPFIQGQVSLNGFDLLIVGLEKSIVSRIVLPLKEFIRQDEGGVFTLAIRPPSDELQDPRLIIRAGEAAVDISSDIDFAGFALQAAELEANHGAIESTRNRELVAQLFHVQSLNSQAVVANDVLIGAYSLIRQQQQIELLYEQLWYCLRVSKSCLQSQKDM
jgi:hypothetical protein